MAAFERSYYFHSVTVSYHLYPLGSNRSGKFSEVWQGGQVSLYRDFKSRGIWQGREICQFGYFQGALN